MLIEHQTFRLADGVDEQAFLDADDRVQQLVANHQEGMLRRTTARGADGTWLVETLWWGADWADAARKAAADHEAVEAFRALVDESTFETRRYETLD